MDWLVRAADPDLVLCIGMLLAVLVISALVSAYSDSRAPRVGSVMALIAAGLIGWAFHSRPGGYALADVIDAVYGVIGRVLG